MLRRRRSQFTASYVPYTLTTTTFISSRLGPPATASQLRRREHGSVPFAGASHLPTGTSCILISGLANDLAMGRQHGGGLIRIPS